MADTYHHPPSDNQQPPVYNSGCLEIPYSANERPPSEAHGPTQPDPTAQRWTPSQGYGGHPYGFRCDFPAPSSSGVAFEGPCLAYSYGYDLSVPCPQPRHFPNMVPTAPGNTYSSKGASAFRTFPQKYGLDSILKQQHGYEGFFDSGAPFGCLLFPPQDKDRTRAEHETAVQGKQDQQWLRRFVQSSDKPSRNPQTKQQQQHCCVPELRQALYTAALLVSQLAKSCETLRNNVENDSVWIDSYLMASNVKRQLQDKLTVLNDSWCLDSWKGKLSCVARKRSQRLRAKKSLQMKEKEKEESISAREADIDTWRMKQIRQVEEKKKEQELKLAADAVLSEVRKKQADVKRMQDVMRSLEKLRRLRKEAASRKGNKPHGTLCIITEQECEESFNSQLQQLRCVFMKRTAVYSAEEKALMVMLEGEQEEEKRRDREKQVKKESERQLHRKHTVDIMLFGDEPSVDSVLQPFREYYTQAERSLHTLLQIRREWDVFVVVSDHPDGTTVPQSWILPEPPSGPAWASALHTADTKSDTAQLTVCDVK